MSSTGHIDEKHSYTDNLWVLFFFLHNYIKIGL